MNSDLLVDITEGVASLTFNRPAVRNAISAEMLDSLLDFLLAAEHDASIRCLVLAGAGPHFMAGGDIRSFAQTADLGPAERRRHFEARVAKGSQVIAVLHRLPQPVIASVRGIAAGAGLGFAIAADILVAARSARFVLAHVNIGASPDVGTSWHLPRAVGVKRAMAMALLAESMDAQMALNCGLATHLVDDESLTTETERLARRLADGPAVAIGQAKVLIRQSLGNSLGEQLAAEARSMGISAGSDDFIEGPRAFLEKRKPQFARAGTAHGAGPARPPDDSSEEVSP